MVSGGIAAALRAAALPPNDPPLGTGSESCTFPPWKSHSKHTAGPRIPNTASIPKLLMEEFWDLSRRFSATGAQQVDGSLFEVHHPLIEQDNVLGANVFSWRSTSGRADRR